MSGTYDLEERTCDGGCGKKFKCLPTSKVTRARANCENLCKGAKFDKKHNRPVPSMGRSIFSKETKDISAQELDQKIEKRVALAKIVPQEQVSRFQEEDDKLAIVAQEQEKIWLQCVDRAKSLVAEVARMRDEITRLAIQCCDMRHGGGAHWSKFEGIYTLKRFAEEVGIRYKTLSHWVAIHRHIVSELTPGEYSEGDFKFAHRALKTIGADPEKRKKLLDRFRDYKKDNGDDYHLQSIIRWTRNNRSFLKRVDLKKLDRTEVEGLFVVVKECSEILGGFLKGQ